MGVNPPCKKEQKKQQLILTSLELMGVKYKSELCPQTRGNSFKAHTDQTRFGNATRISDVQCRLTLILVHCSQTFGYVLEI